MPAAVDYEDRLALDGLDDASLGKLMTECERWFACAEEFQAALSTAAGRTEWNVHMRQETSDVAAAHARIRDEVEERNARSADGCQPVGPSA